MATGGAAPSPKDFSALFPNAGFSLDALKTQFQSSGARDRKYRSIGWKAFLGCFGDSQPSDWSARMGEHRATYEKHLENFLIDPHQADEAGADSDNPLADEGGSKWEVYFENKEIEETIMLDITRTFQDKEYFTKESTHQMMLRILFVWCKLNDDISYRQGMNELLALILMVVECDKKKLKLKEGYTERSVYAVLVDSTYLEHDVFTMFAALMKEMKEYYRPPPRRQRPSDNKGKKDVPPPPPVPECVIITKADNLQNHLLKSMDHELFTHLDGMQIEPQLYALKWFRLILAREFHLEDSIAIWDAILASGVGLPLLDYVCLSMLLYIRVTLLEGDYLYVQRRLLKFPPVEHPWVLVEKAVLLLANPRADIAVPPELKKTPDTAGGRDDAAQLFPPGSSPSSAGAKPRGKSSAASSAAAAASSFGSAISKSMKAGLPLKNPLSRGDRTQGQPGGGAQSPRAGRALPAREQQIVNLTQKLNLLQHQRESASLALDQVASALQKHLVDVHFLSREQEDMAMVSIAQIKKVRDVLVLDVDLIDEEDSLTFLDAMMTVTMVNEEANAVAKQQGDDDDSEVIITGPLTIQEHGGSPGMVDTGCTEGGGTQGVSGSTEAGSTEGVLSKTTDTPTAPPVPMDTTPDDASVGGVSDKVKVPNPDKVPTGVSGGESSAEGESDKDSETKATPPLTTTEDTAAADSADKQDDDEEEEEEEEEEEVGEEGATRIENIMKTVEDQYGGDDYDSSGGGDEEWEDPADKAARLKEEEVLAAKKAALLRRASRRPRKTSADMQKVLGDVVATEGDASGKDGKGGGGLFGDDGGKTVGKDLFGGDDDDDPFGIAAPPASSASATSSAPGKTKKSAGKKDSGGGKKATAKKGTGDASSLFGDIEPSKPASSVGKVTKKREVVQKDALFDSPAPKGGTSAASALFDSTAPSDSLDLLAGGNAKPKKKPTKKKPAEDLLDDLFS